MGLRDDDPLSPSKPWPDLTRVEREIGYLMVFGLPVPRALSELRRTTAIRSPARAVWPTRRPSATIWRLCRRGGLPMANELAHINKLSTVEQEIARLMVDGLDHDETILGEDVPAFWPLTLVQAARACGYPMKKARNYLGDHPPFNALRRKIMDGAEKPRRRGTS